MGKNRAGGKDPVWAKTRDVAAFIALAGTSFRKAIAFRDGVRSSFMFLNMRIGGGLS